MTDVTIEHIWFLRSVKAGGRIGLADRKADRIRQFCRRNGYAEVLRGPRRWSVTEKGEHLIEAWEPSP